MRLKVPVSPVLRSVTRSCFNSKLVRLKDDKLVEQEATETGFNSKLVRLKGEAQQAFRPDTISFQFQTGAIKSVDSEDILYIRRMSFNSKLVRLKVKYKVRSHMDVDMFQFQTGAIKSAMNFVNVIDDFEVSIPNWCD